LDVDAFPRKKEKSSDLSGNISGGLICRDRVAAANDLRIGSIDIVYGTDLIVGNREVKNIPL
jgi:hypothetical protein